MTATESKTYDEQPHFITTKRTDVRDTAIKGVINLPNSFPTYNTGLNKSCAPDFTNKI
jgi:hypothetical protein